MFNKYKNSGNQKGIISEELVHRIDNMNDSIIDNDKLYKAQKKHTVQESKLFNENAYTDSMYKEDDEETIQDDSSVVKLLILIIVVILIGTIAYIIY